MALAATHLRIALDLAPLAGPTDIDGYFAGTLYPDSRNLTGIPREKTHGKEHLQYLMNKDFSDFHTGWAIHLYYDQISGEMQKALMPPILVLSQERNYAWAYFTAIKIIEDMFSARVIQTELREELHTLTSVAIDRAPNGESLEDLRKYFADVETLYKNGPPTLEAYEALFRTYRLSEQVLTDMMTITTELMTNDTTSRRIEKIYRDTLNEFINIHLGMTRL